VDGTTGYELIASLGGLFVDPAGEEPLTRLYHELTGEPVDWPAIACACRHQILREALWSDLARLAHWGVRVCEGRRRYRDFTSWDVREALAEVLVCFPVYRTYVTEDGERSEADRELIEQAVADARQRRPDLATELFDLIEAVLGGGADGGAERELRMRFQQLTGPVMAKATEDTAFYRFVRFVALNEVGGAPDRFGVSPAVFHERCREVAERWPRTLLALSTHDTKRSEDVRARLALLSEMPSAWAEVVRRWSAHNARHRTAVGLPDANVEYLFYQTLVGAWPLPVERALAYMVKAAREAKARTSWTAPAEDYEAALEAFVREALADAEFERSLAAFVEPLVAPGRVNALAQKLVQLTAPGVPDLYQGSELWDSSLVDPDNRRPVDFDLRRRLLAELQAAEAGGAGAAARAMSAREDEGGPKLWVVRQALRVRCRRTAAFAPGASYEPLTARGPAADHALAFARAGQVVTVVPRLVLGLERRGGWGETEVELPPGRWRDTLTDASVSGRARVTALLEAFPVALLERDE
jgi:(1->4)-alpha-D-glucan 1-alpha-D-glucosylmutase